MPRCPSAPSVLRCIDDIRGVYVLQYDLFNCLLRRHPAARFQDYEKGRNLFSTTTAVLASAVQKLARVAKIREGTLFYRGLNRLMELPDEFFRPDEQGRRGFAEWGFLSTTQNKEIALTYSGMREGWEGRPMPMVLVIKSSVVDRGASIEAFSQYPQVAAVQCLTGMRLRCDRCVTGHRDVGRK